VSFDVFNSVSEGLELTKLFKLMHLKKSEIMTNDYDDDAIVCSRPSVYEFLLTLDTQLLFVFQFAYMTYVWQTCCCFQVFSNVQNILAFLRGLQRCSSITSCSSHSFVVKCAVSQVRFHSVFY
jgi:hypothetical protein